MSGQHFEINERGFGYHATPKTGYGWFLTLFPALLYIVLCVAAGVMLVLHKVGLFEFLVILIIGFFALLRSLTKLVYRHGTVVSPQ